MKKEKKERERLSYSGTSVTQFYSFDRSSTGLGSKYLSRYTVKQLYGSAHHFQSQDKSKRGGRKRAAYMQGLNTHLTAQNACSYT